MEKVKAFIFLYTHVFTYVYIQAYVHHENVNEFEMSMLISKTPMYARKCSQGSTQQAASFLQVAVGRPAHGYSLRATLCVPWQV